VIGEVVCYFFFFFFKQKTAYEIRSGDWSSDVCSSDLAVGKEYVAATPRKKRQALMAQMRSHLTPTGKLRGNR